MHKLLRTYAWYRSFLILFYHPFTVMLDNEADIFIEMVEFLIPVPSCNYSAANKRVSDRHRQKYLSNVKRKKRRKDKFRKKALFNAKHNLHWKQHVRLKQKDFLNQPLPGKSQYSMLESDSSAVTQRKKDARRRYLVYLQILKTGYCLGGDCTSVRATLVVPAETASYLPSLL